MARFPGLVGPSNTERSLQSDDEEAINLIPRLVSAGTPKSRAYYYGRPGLTAAIGVGSGPIRALFYQDGRAFAVSGGIFYEFWVNGEVAQWGEVAVDTNPATISSNGTAGNQLFITSGGLGYTFDTEFNDFAQITDAAFPNPALMGAFCDGYFVVLKGQSRQFSISDLEDGSSWNGLDIGEVSTTSENIVAMAVLHREIWLWGSKTTQVWYDSGAANFPFQPRDVFIQQGCAAPWSPVLLDNTVFWLGANENGAGVVYRANGYNPERVSTHAIETYINRLERMDDCIGWAYQEEGQAYYVMYFPKADATLFFDVSTGLWHKRAIWVTLPPPGRWYPHLGRCHAYAFGKHYIGDRQSGTLYVQSLTQYSDDLVIGTGL